MDLLFEMKIKTSCARGAVSVCVSVPVYVSGLKTFALYEYPAEKKHAARARESLKSAMNPSA